MKQLIIKPKLCINCHVCEHACAMEHAEDEALEFSRIRVIAFEGEDTSVPETCLQCVDAACIAVCPAGAIDVLDELGTVLIDYGKCVGCMSCVAGCPFGNMLYDKNEHGYVFKCDMCFGDPACARFCPTGAIKYEEISPLTGMQQMVLEESAG